MFQREAVDACHDINTLSVQTPLPPPKTNRRLWLHHLNVWPSLFSSGGGLSLTLAERCTAPANWRACAATRGASCAAIHHRAATVPVVVLPVMMVQPPLRSMMVMGTAPDAERREAGSLVPARSSCRVKFAQKPRRQTIHQARIPTKFATARRNETNRCAVNVDNRGAGHAAFDAAL